MPKPAPIASLPPPTWAEAVDRVFAAYSPRTRQAYESDWAGFLRDVFGVEGGRAAPERAVRPCLGSLRPDMLSRWVEQMERDDLAKATIKRRLSSVRSVLSALHASGGVKQNLLVGLRIRVGGAPQRDVVPPPNSVVKRVDAWLARRAWEEPDDLARLRDVCLFGLLAWSGARASEVLSLTNARWQAAVRVSKRGPRAVMLTAKGGHARSVVVPPDVAALIDRYIKRYAMGSSMGRVFLAARTGKPIGYRTLFRLVKSAGAAVGYPALHPHALRHWYVTRALDLGVSLSDVASAVGHRQASTTLGYAHGQASTPGCDEATARVLRNTGSTWRKMRH